MKVTLKEVGEIVTGNTPSKTNLDYWNHKDICFVKPDIIDDKGVNYIDDSNEYISEFARSKARIVKENTIFVTCIGSIGKIGIAAKGDYAFNQQINAIIPNDKIVPKYLAYCMLYNKPRLIDIANAPVVPIINKSQFGEFEINVNSSLEKQAKIVDILDRIEDIIHKREKELQLLDEIIKARFVEMFGEPIANQKGWAVKTLKELSILITNGNTPKGGSENYVEKGIMFLRSQNVWRNRIELDDVAYIDEATHQSMKKSSLHYKDILITKTGRINTENSSLGRAALFLGEDNSANINGHVYLVRLSDEVIPEYVVTILTGEAYRKYIRKVCVGGIDKRQINVDHVENFPIIMPPIEMQREFAYFVKQVNKSKVAIQSALDQTQQLFDSLMQEYFG
jgi:type I restriction enzyme S subunit